MARPARPWYRAERDAWYVTIGGKKILLARGKDARREAEAAFHRVKAAEAEPNRLGGGPAAPAVVVGEIGARFLADCRERVALGTLTAGTRRDYVRRLQDFLRAFGAAPVSGLRSRAVLAWVEAQTRWGPTSRHDVVTSIKTMLTWAVENELIATNPLAGLKKPRRSRRRPHVMSGAEVEAFFAAIVSKDFHDMMRFCFLTGCRPFEARRLSSEHIDRTTWVARFRGKNSWKTQALRVLPLPAVAREIVARRLEAQGAGPVFRNEDGSAWTRSAVNDQVRRMRARCAALGKGATPGALRHLFATDGLAKGQPPAVLAKFLDTSISMFDRTYSRLEDRVEDLRAAAEAVRREKAG
jgi:integrase/recombinase XerC